MNDNSRPCRRSQKRITRRLPTWKPVKPWVAKRLSRLWEKRDIVPAAGSLSKFPIRRLRSEGKGEGKGDAA